MATTGYWTNLLGELQVTVKILVGDATERLRTLPDGSVHCVVTSPPYWGLRAYDGEPGMIGLEPTFGEHLENLVKVFGELRRVLRPDGTVWLNYGDAYAGGNNKGEWAASGAPVRGTGRAAPNTNLKPKDLMMMPARVAIALQEDGWWLRSEIIWHKPNPMPESARDRPTSAHEKIYLLAKIEIQNKRPGRERERTNKQTKPNKSGANLRNVWAIATHPYRKVKSKTSHFATFPPKLVEPCIKAGTSEHGVCGDCGAPWVRVAQICDPDNRLGESYHDHTDDLGRGQRGVPSAKGAPSRKTTGWRPSCACEASVIPATVLDPFAGVGTVGLVADRLGRDAILIEISPKYAKMAGDRIHDDSPLFSQVELK